MSLFGEIGKPNAFTTEKMRMPLVLGIAESLTIPFGFLVIVGIIRVAFAITNHKFEHTTIPTKKSRPISLTHVRRNMLIDEGDDFFPVFTR